MKNFRKPLLTLGIGACLLGGALTTLGSVSGGLTNLIQASNKDLKVTKVEESYEDIQSLTIDLNNRSLVIQESSDNQAHLTYYQSENHQVDGKTIGKVTATYQNQNLQLQDEKEPTFIPFNTGIRSLLSIFDQESNEKRTVTLALPKGSQLSNLKVKILDGSLSLSHLTADQADIQMGAGSMQIEDSQLKNSKIAGFDGSVNMKRTILSQSELTLTAGSAEILESQLEAVTLTDTDGSIQLSQSRLADSNLTLTAGRLTSSNLDIAGNTSITSRDGSVDLNLTSDSYQTLNYDLQAQDGSTSLPNDFQNTRDGATGSLTVRTLAGSITISHGQ